MLAASFAKGGAKDFSKRLRREAPQVSCEHLMSVNVISSFFTIFFRG